MGHSCGQRMCWTKPQAFLFRSVGHRGLIVALLPRLPYTFFSCTFSALTIFSPGSEIYVLTSVMVTYMSHGVMPCYECNKCHITQYTWHPIYGCWSNCRAVQAGVSQDILGRACWLPPLSYCLTRSPLFHKQTRKAPAGQVMPHL